MPSQVRMNCVIASSISWLKVEATRRRRGRWGLKAEGKVRWTLSLLNTKTVAQRSNNSSPLRTRKRSERTTAKNHSRFVCWYDSETARTKLRGVSFKTFNEAADENKNVLLLLHASIDTARALKTVKLPIKLFAAWTATSVENQASDLNGIYKSNKKMNLMRVLG